jgi:hypothetical protein
VAWFRGVKLSSRTANDLGFSGKIVTVSDREGSDVTVPKWGGIKDQSSQRLRHCLILGSNVSAYLRTESSELDLKEASLLFT